MQDGLLSLSCQHAVTLSFGSVCDEFCHDFVDLRWDRAPWWLITHRRAQVAASPDRAVDHAKNPSGDLTE
jgi:hypothetical protein